MVIETGFGEDGRGGRTSFVPSASPFADNTARDTWAAANLGELRNDEDQVTLITVAGEAFEWSGAHEPSAYNSNGWIPRSRLPTGPEVKQLYESNPDTNPFLDAEKAEIDSLEAIPDGTIPIKSGETFVASSLAQVGSVLESTSMIAVPDALGGMFGAVQLVNGGFNIAAETADGRVFFPIASELDGSSARPIWIKLGNSETRTLNPGQDETFTGQQIQFKFVNANTGLGVEYIFHSESILTVADVNATFRAGSHTGAVIFDYKRANGGTGFAIAPGDNNVVIPGIGLFFRAGVEIFVTIEAPVGQTLSLAGQTIEVTGTNETIPYLRIIGHLSEDITLMTEDDNEIRSLTLKNTPQGDDVLVIEDSADSFSKKRIAIESLPAIAETVPFPNFDNAILLSSNGDDANEGLTLRHPVQTLDEAITKAAALTGDDNWIICLDGSALTTALSTIPDGTKIWAPFATLTSDVAGPTTGQVFVLVYKLDGNLTVGAADTFILGVQDGNVALRGTNHTNSLVVIDDFVAGLITMAGATGRAGLFIRRVHTGNFITVDDNINLYGYVGDEMYSKIASTRVTGNFEQSKITGLHNALVAKADSPLSTVAGRFTRWGDTQGGLDGGADSVGAGNTVVTLDSHGKIPTDVLRDVAFLEYPNLPDQGFTSDITIDSGTLSNYEGSVNIFDGPNITVTIDQASTLTTKTDFSDDQDTIVIVNFDPGPLTITITDNEDRFRVNNGSLNSDLVLPQFHYASLCRTSGFQNRIFVFKFGHLHFVQPSNAAINITNFSVARDVPIPTTISGPQTVTFDAINSQNMDRDSQSVVANGRAGGVDFSGDSVNISSHIITEGINTVEYNVATARTLSLAGDYYEIIISFSLINPNVNTTSTDDWRIDARTADHPSQGTFKSGWLDGNITTVAYGSTTIDSTAVYNDANVQIGTGPEILKAIPNDYNIPGLDADGKRLLIEVQDDIGVIANIIENAGTPFQLVLYDHSAPESPSNAMNAIKYSKDVNGVSKGFTLIYTRDTRIEEYDTKSLIIHTV